jgi:hypothetical protein
VIGADRDIDVMPRAKDFAETDRYECGLNNMLIPLIKVFLCKVMQQSDNRDNNCGNWQLIVSPV